MHPKVLLDTNILVSALINPKGYPAKVFDFWIKGEFQLVISIPLLEELIHVLQRPRIKDKYNLTSEIISEFIELISKKTEHVITSGKFLLCRDPYDNMVLETALLGHAEYLVTRDDDIKRDKELIEQMRLHNVNVLSVSKFMSLLQLK